MSKTTAPSIWQQLPPLERPRPETTTRSEFDPLAAEVEALAIMVKAQEASESLMALAKDDYTKLIDRANQEAIQIRASAKLQGEQDGQEAAQETAHRELSEEWKVRTDALKLDVQTIVEAICHERKCLWEQTEQEVLAFVLEMAKRVVKVELTQNNKVIDEIIRHSLRRVSDKENVRIRVNPEELEAVRADRKDLLLVLDGARQLEIVDDRRVGRGGCVIETAAGTIDATIDTQFEQIADKLGIESSGGEASQ